MKNKVLLLMLICLILPNSIQAASLKEINTTLNQIYVSPKSNLSTVAFDIQQAIDPDIPVPQGTAISSPMHNMSIVSSNVTVRNQNLNIKPVYAYRLDFLTALKTPRSNNSLVHYGTGAHDHTSIAARNITTSIIQMPFTITAPFTAQQTSSGMFGIYQFTLNFPQFATRHVYALRSMSGKLDDILDAITLPSGELSIARDIGPAGNVLGNGMGGKNGDRLSFMSGINYGLLSRNPVAQRQLFIIPNSRGTGELLPDAAAIKSSVDFALRFNIETLQDFYRYDQFYEYLPTLIQTLQNIYNDLPDEDINKTDLKNIIMLMKDIIDTPNDLIDAFTKLANYQQNQVTEEYSELFSYIKKLAHTISIFIPAAKPKQTE